jgi:hypothetical protein
LEKTVLWSRVEVIVRKKQLSKYLQAVCQGGYTYPNPAMLLSGLRIFRLLRMIIFQTVGDKVSEDLGLGHTSLEYRINFAGKVLQHPYFLDPLVQQMIEGAPAEAKKGHRFLPLYERAEWTAKLLLRKLTNAMMGAWQRTHPAGQANSNGSVIREYQHGAVEGSRSAMSQALTKKAVSEQGNSRGH